MLNVILVPIYTGVMLPGAYGQVVVIYAYFAIFNIFLAYGMETAFFRFYKDSENKKKVVSTSFLVDRSGLAYLAGITFKRSIKVRIMRIKRGNDHKNSFYLFYHFAFMRYIGRNYSFQI